MYIRTVTAKGNKYVQLAHSYRDPETGVSKVRVLHNLGRADRLDVEGLRRLVRGICRFLEPYEGKALQQELGMESPFEFLGSRDLGVSWLLDSMATSYAVASAYRVRRFTEKPGLEDALECLKHDRHLWNAGIFAWRLSAIRQAPKRHTPALYEELTTIEGLLRRGQDVGVREGFLYRVREIFLAMVHTSIDYALLEKADNILVVPGDFGWDDVGTWAALERIYDKDENGNVINGKAFAIEASGNIIENSVGDKLFVVSGVKNLVMVNSEDIVLVADKRRSGSLKKVTEALKACGLLEASKGAEVSCQDPFVPEAKAPIR